jgi:hypothetical protein
MTEYYTPDGTLVRYNTQIFNLPEFDMDNSNNPESDTANQEGEQEPRFCFEDLLFDDDYGNDDDDGEGVCQGPPVETIEQLEDGYCRAS